MHAATQFIEIAIFRVVLATVLPNPSHVLCDIVQSTVLSLVQSSLDGAQIHRIADYSWVAGMVDHIEVVRRSSGGTSAGEGHAPRRVLTRRDLGSSNRPDLETEPHPILRRMC